MAKLIVPGREVAPEKPEEKLVDGLMTVRTIHQSETDGVTRGDLEEHPFDKAQDDDIVEVEWEGGVREWISVGQLREALATQTPTGRGIAPQPAVEADLRIPAFRHSATGTRGAGGWGLKILKIFRVDVADELATVGVRKLTEKIEGKIQPALQRLREDFTFAPLGALPKEDPGPYLVFLHGTASSTRGSFGGLEGRDEETGKIKEGADREWRALRGLYGDRILALEHRTMSVSPVQNALDLVGKLPEKAKLHLVSHSRGGLVGELLCVGQYAEADLEPFAGREDRSLLKELSDLLAQRQLMIERFVRVACPAQGTVLASRRLDLYLSVLLNLFGLIPGLQGTLWYQIVKATLLAAAKKRSDIGELPGLEAMMPESPLIRFLNSSAAKKKAELGVIAGDIEGEGIWGRIKIFATDLFYLQDHDLVVNTRSMYGGAGRDEVYFLFDQGPNVSHFNYFRNKRTREALYTWLTRKEGELKPFQARQKRAPAAPRRGETRGREEGPAVFLVPDLFGSCLASQQGERVWLDLPALSRGEMEQLEIDRKVEVEGLLPGVYDSLIEALGFYQVLPFPYDWRRSFRDVGDELAEAIQKKLDEQPVGPVHIIAHGAGGLAVRALIAEKPEIWQRIRDRQGWAVMLGTPNHGSYFALGLLLGEEKLIRLLDLVDFRHEKEDLLGIFRSYPSLYEMLPQDLFDEQKRRSLWAEGSADRALVEGEALHNAQAFRAKLDGGAREGLLYVAGAAPWTPSGIRREEHRLLFELSSKGDGLVSYELGRLDGIATWYVDAGHGELVSHRPLFLALPDLLDRGSTVKLPKLPSPGERAVRIREAPPLLFPSEEDLAQAALGEPTPRPAWSLRVSVVHGDLTHSPHPVAVGHYVNDTIVNAERVLDRQLGGALMRRYQMGLYPGAVGTSEVIHASAAQPPGVLVIGLGEVGDITAQKVTLGVTLALLRHALLVAEHPAAPGEGTPAQDGAGSQWQRAGVSAVLLGAGGGRSISVEESVAAIVRGAIEANRALKAQGLWDRVRIDAIQLIELYETVAIRAARAARSLESQLQLYLQPGEGLDVAPYLKTLPGGRVRPPVSQYATGWWRRLQITVEEKDKRATLVFEALTDRARTEELKQDLPREIVDHFVAEAASGPQYDREIASTLFELLLPNTLKDQAQEEADLVLLLDQETAQYPWELLTERSRGASDPFAVCAGLVRQLKLGEGEFRSVVHAPRDRFALAVGEPQSDWTPIPKAQAEARAVTEVLRRGGYAVTSLIASDGLTLLRELYARDYQIVHLAGHGNFDLDDRDRTGMVIGKNLFLTASLIRRLRTVPPFVFLNCCHLGKMDRRHVPGKVEDFRRLAASLATALIGMGARAVVAAGWEINDNLAELFATRLYEELLAGRTFGRATLLARQAVYKEAPDDNTWAAYQCYGDPDFLLDPQAAVRGAGADPRSYVAAREFLDEFESLYNAAKSALPADREALQQRLDQVEAALPAEWRTGELLEALGQARNQVGQWQEAIAAYEAAVRDEGAVVSLRAIESLANLMGRYAEQLRKTEVPPEDQQKLNEQRQKLIQDARWYLDWLDQLPPTSERFSLYGSLYKRIALGARTKQERRRALSRAAESYQRAHQLKAKGGRIDPYPVLNWIACRYLSGPLTEKEGEEFEKLIQRSEETAKELAANDPSFFHRLYPADLALHRHLLAGDLGTRKEEVLRLYRRALAVGSGFTESSSMREHFGFLLSMMDPTSPAAKALQEIARDLEETAA